MIEKTFQKRPLLLLSKGLFLTSFFYKFFYFLFFLSEESPIRAAPNVIIIATARIPKDTTLLGIYLAKVDKGVPKIPNQTKVISLEKHLEIPHNHHHR